MLFHSLHWNWFYSFFLSLIYRSESQIVKGEKRWGARDRISALNKTFDFFSFFFTSNKRRLPTGLSKTFLISFWKQRTPSDSAAKAATTQFKLYLERASHLRFGCFHSAVVYFSDNIRYNCVISSVVWKEWRNCFLLSLFLRIIVVCVQTVGYLLVISWVLATSLDINHTSNLERR